MADEQYTDREFYLEICRRDGLEVDSPESYARIWKILLAVEQDHHMSIQLMKALLEWVLTQEIPALVRDGIKEGLRQIKGKDLSEEN